MVAVLKKGVGRKRNPNGYDLVGEVKTTYADQHDDSDEGSARRRLDWRSRLVRYGEEAGEAIRAIKRYNSFSPGILIKALDDEEWHQGIIIGREGSPVIYLVSEGPFDPSTWKRFGRRVKADEVGTPQWGLFGGGSYPEVAPYLPYVLRLWWD